MLYAVILLIVTFFVILFLASMISAYVNLKSNNRLTYTGFWKESFDNFLDYFRE